MVKVNANLAIRGNSKWTKLIGSAKGEKTANSYKRSKGLSEMPSTKKRELIARKREER